MPTSTPPRIRQTATRADRVALTDLLRSIRPDWDRWLIESVLQSHERSYDIADLAVAAIRWAHDPRATTPKGIVWPGRHWRDLDDQPDSSRINDGPRCSVCGKPEARCITERPGPDDHEFEVRV